MFRSLKLLVIVVGLGFCSGCTMMEYLKPHQLWKLNRQPSMMREDAYFSIPARPVVPESAKPEPAQSADPRQQPSQFRK